MIFKHSLRTYSSMESIKDPFRITILFKIDLLHCNPHDNQGIPPFRKSPIKVLGHLPFLERQVSEEIEHLHTLEIGFLLTPGILHDPRKVHIVLR